MSASLDRPEAVGSLAERWAIGLLRLPGGYQPYTVSLRDIERDTAWASKVFELLGVRPGLPLHLIGAGCDNEILWPYENALIGMKVPFGVAEPVAIDAPRSDMFLRRFRMQAVLGLSGELVDAFMALGRDLQALLGHSIVAAMPEALPALRAAGLTPWTQRQIGPILHIRVAPGRWRTLRRERVADRSARRRAAAQQRGAARLPVRAPAHWRARPRRAARRRAARAR
jgi:hypothetical protein